MGLTEFLLVVAVGGGIAAVLFATFRGAASESDMEERDERPATTAASRKAEELAERRRAAEASLAEIEADREVGDLSDADYESLARRYRAEVARLDEELGDLAAAGDEAGKEEAVAPARGGGWMTAAGWVAGSVAFVAIAWLVLSQALSPRTGEGQISGSIPGQGMGAANPAVPVAPVDEDRLAALERMVAEDPNDLEALVELGHLYLRQQRIEELTTVTQQALALDPNNPEALTHLGMLLFSMGHPEGIMPTFDRALEVDPNFPEALEFKGMVAFMMQDYATAAEAWGRFVEVVPEDEVPPRITAMLEMARANAGSAESQ